MGLCENVYRRGAVYWWRGRFGPKGEASRTVAVSLRTRNPDRARALGARLTGMALRTREQVRTGAMSIGDVRECFIEAGPGQRFHFDPAVFDHISDAETGRETKPVGLPYTLGREREMLAAFGRRVLEKLHRRAADVRAQRPLVLADGATSPVEEAIKADRVQGHPPAPLRHGSGCHRDRRGLYRGPDVRRAGPHPAFSAGGPRQRRSAEARSAQEGRKARPVTVGSGRPPAIHAQGGQMNGRSVFLRRAPVRSASRHGGEMSSRRDHPPRDRHAKQRISPCDDTAPAYSAGCRISMRKRTDTSPAV